jgi:hypothetical protein
LQQGFQGFTELVILKVLQAHKDQEKDVSIYLVLFSIVEMTRVSVFRIRIHLILTRIQHFRLNTDPDSGV